MNILRNLGKMFSGSPSATSADVGLYYYVKCNQTDEVLRVRINPNNDLSRDDEGEGFFVRKHLTGKRGYNKIEVLFNYDKNRKLIDSEINGGKLVDLQAYEAYLANQSE